MLVTCGTSAVVRPGWCCLNAPAEKKPIVSNHCICQEKMQDEYNLQPSIKSILLQEGYSDYSHLIKRQGKCTETASFIHNLIPDGL